MRTETWLKALPNGCFLIEICLFLTKFWKGIVILLDIKYTLHFIQAIIKIIMVVRRSKGEGNPNWIGAFVPRKIQALSRLNVIFFINFFLCFKIFIVHLKPFLVKISFLIEDVFLLAFYHSFFFKLFFRHFLNHPIKDELDGGASCFSSFFAILMLKCFHQSQSHLTSVSGIIWQLVILTSWNTEYSSSLFPNVMVG